MKNINILKIFIGCTLITLTSCDNNDIGVEPNNVKDYYHGTDPNQILGYVEGVESGRGFLNFNAVNNMEETVIKGESESNLKVLLTRASDYDTDVALKADNSLVDAYNETNNTFFLPLLSEAYEISKENFTIKKGELESEEVSVKILDPGLLTSTDGYIIPLIAQFASNDEVKTESNRCVLYVQVDLELNNIDHSMNLVEGDLIDKTDWIITSARNKNNAKLSNGATSDSWWEFISSSFIQIDMGETHLVKGVVFSADSHYPSEKPKKMTILMSLDGVKWISYGTFQNDDLVGDFADVHVALNVPIEAKYVKFINFTAVGNGSYLSLSEVSIIE